MITKVLGLGSKISLPKKGITGEVTTITAKGVGIKKKDGTLSCITLSDADKLIDSGELKITQL